MKSETRRYAKRGLIPIVGDVTADMFSETAHIIEELLLIGAPDIKIVIASGGGDVGAGLDIYDLIKTYPGRSTGIVYRNAASMGAIILQACDVRLCGQHADVRVHHISQNNVSLDIFNDPSGNKLKDIEKALRESQHRLYEILVARTGKSLEDVMVIFRNDRPMTATKAQELNLIDRILSKEDMAEWLRPDVLAELKKFQKVPN